MNQWVNISAPLPPFDTPVLVLINGIRLRAALRRNDEETGWVWALCTGDLNDLNDFDDEDDYNVTHWMPLPELPQRSET